MSTTKRIFSAGIANATSILVNLVSQVVTVPFFISMWGVEKYGAWLLVVSTLSLLSIVDVGHQNFLGYVFIGKNSKRRVSANFFSAIPFSIGVGLCSLGIALSCLNPMIASKVFSGLRSASLTHEAAFALIVGSATWFICGGTLGVLGRTIVAFGYYPRLAWWTALYTFLQVAAPLLACLMGGSLPAAALALSAAALTYNAFLTFDIIRTWKRIGVPISRPNLSVGFTNFSKSTLVSLRELLSFIRQTGMRLVVAPLVGPIGLAQFSTTRTFSNVLLQGLNTITNPIEPELLAATRMRKQGKVTTLMASVWLITSFVICPGLTALQFLSAQLYGTWTSNKLPYDGQLFSLLSGSVAVYACAQPLMAVVRGNNLIVSQFVIAALSALLAVGGAVMMVHQIGVRGIGMALLASEILALAGYTLVARHWLLRNLENWPATTLAATLASVTVTVVGSSMMGAIPEHQLALAISTIFVSTLAGILSLCTLPPSSHDLYIELIKRVILRRVR